MDAIAWHSLCHELDFDSRYHSRAMGFETEFNCEVKWQSGLPGWNGKGEQPNSIMRLTFKESEEAVLFTLKWL